VIADAFTAERIGAAWLRTALAPVSEFGRRADDAAETAPGADADEARRRCAQVLRLADDLERDGVAAIRAALRSVPDPLAIVARARAGDPLGDVDFYELGRFADALESVRRAWLDAGGDAADLPASSGIATLIAPGRGGPGFYLDDAFDPVLADARETMGQAEARVARERARLGEAVAEELGFVPEGDEFVVVREHLAGPLPHGVRIVRETPAYLLCALERDVNALLAETERDGERRLLAASEDRVRRELANGIARQRDGIRAATVQLGELDRLLARVAVVQRFGGCVPDFVEGGFALVDATYAPLAETLAAEGRAYTPLSLELRAAAVLTGPNMGGKSAALALCGFVVACIAAGLPPPARAVRLPPLQRVVWIGGGDADRARLLSAFATEVIRARDTLAGGPEPALVLVDEYARTTGPREGRALSIALVEALAQRPATVALIATHFDGVAEAAGVPHLRVAGAASAVLGVIGAGELHDALDAIGAAMDYRIVAAHEAAAASDAIALARILGLPAALIARAVALAAS
jgi:DNA mismatch repair protein MutS2